MNDIDELPPLRCAACDVVLLEVHGRALAGEEIAAVTARHYASVHGGVSVPPQRLPASRDR